MSHKLSIKEAIIECASQEADKKRPQEALDILLAVPDQEKNGRIHFAIGQVYYLTSIEKTEKDLAIQHYEQCVEKSNDASLAMYYLSFLYEEKGDRDKMMRWLEKAASEPNNHVYAMFDLAVQYDKKASLQKQVSFYVGSCKI